MMHEEIEWNLCANGLPDADRTVMIANEDWDSDPVWMGFLDGDGWRFVDGSLVDPELAPTHWAEVPVGPFARKEGGR